MTDKTKQTKEKDQPTNQLAIPKTIADSVLARVQQFTANRDIRLPADYSPENALKSAWLILLEAKTKDSKPVLEHCTRESIANALLNMVLQGLNPVKKQCDFIAYGDKLYMQREYHGTVALAKRYAAIKDPIANIIYEGDEFEYSINEYGVKTITKHTQNLDNIDLNKIKGAYATIRFEDPEKEPHIEIMTMTQIRQAWMQGATKGASPAHKNFPDEMAKKTVIGRACKLFITSSDDSSLFEDPEVDNFTTTAREKAAERANREELTMDIEAEVVNDNGKKKPEPKPQKPKEKPAEEPAEDPEPTPGADLFDEANEANPGF
jgi:recombination protein RecT